MDATKIESAHDECPEIEPVYRSEHVVVTEEHSAWTLLRGLAINPRNVMVILGPDDTPSIVRWIPDVQLWICHIAVPTE